MGMLLWIQNKIYSVYFIFVYYFRFYMRSFIMTFVLWPILYILLLFIFQVLQKVFCLYYIYPLSWSLSSDLFSTFYCSTEGFLPLLHIHYCDLCPLTYSVHFIVYFPDSTEGFLPLSHITLSLLWPLPSDLV